MCVAQIFQFCFKEKAKMTNVLHLIAWWASRYQSITLIMLSMCHFFLTSIPATSSFQKHKVMQSPSQLLLPSQVQSKHFIWLEQQRVEQIKPTSENNVLQQQPWRRKDEIYDNVPNRWIVYPVRCRLLHKTQATAIIGNKNFQEATTSGKWHLQRSDGELSLPDLCVLLL